jgi:anti-sigma factor RsiW
MPCSRLRPLLSLYAGGELDIVANSDVERHLSDCPACRTEAAGYSSQRGVLGRYGRQRAVAPAMPDVCGDVLARLNGAAPRVGEGAPPVLEARGTFEPRG